MDDVTLAGGLRVSQRQPTACRECSRRKVRCDKQVPCARCVRLRRPCTREIVRVSKVLSRHRDELQFLRHILGRLRSDEDPQGVIEDVNRRVHDLEHGVASPGEDASLADVLDDPGVESSVAGTQPLPERETVGEAVISLPSQSSKADSSENLRSDNASVLAAVEFLAWGRRSAACYPHRACQCYQHRSYSELVSINSDPAWPNRQLSPAQIEPGLLMSAEKSRQIIGFHLDHILWHHAAFHAPTFLDQCETFWQSGTVDQPLWLALYLSVFSVSLWTLLNNDAHRQALDLVIDESLIEAQMRAMVQVLYRENFLEALSLYSVQAIVISTRVAHNIGLSELHSTLISAAVRIAHCMGLHKIRDSPPKLGIGESSAAWYGRVEVETGKRAWTQLVIQDHFQIPFTDSYIIHPSHFITPWPSNCDDHDLVERDDSIPTISSYVRTLAAIAELIPPVLDGLGPMGSRKPIQEIYAHILASDKKMRAVVQRIPPFLLREPAAADPSAPPWLLQARRSLAITASDKIIMIHRPVLFHSFQTPHFSRTRTTCVAAAITILREHEQATNENSISVWTHTALCVTAAMVIGLELLHRTDHTDDEAHSHRQMITRAAERLRDRRCDVIAARGASLIDTILATEEDLVIRMMRVARQQGRGSTELLQRQLINDMIGSHEIMAKFLALAPSQSGDSLSVGASSPDGGDPFASITLGESPLGSDFDAWFNDVFAPMHPQQTL